MIQETTESKIECAFTNSIIIITQVKSWVWPLALHFISRPPKKPWWVPWCPQALRWGLLL